jgi:hypothetical protein
MPRPPPPLFLALAALFLLVACKPKVRDFTSSGAGGSGGDSSSASGGAGGAGGMGGMGGMGGGVDCKSAGDQQACIQCCYDTSPEGTVALYTALFSRCGCDGAMCNPYCIDSSTGQCYKGDSMDVQAQQCADCINMLIMANDPCLQYVNEDCNIDPVCVPLLECQAACQ